MLQKDSPFISVVIPTYNRQKYLKECLDAFDMQTYPRDLFEIIVVDDGSTDGTYSFFSEYTKRASFTLIPLHKENRGPSSARNLGIKEGKGDLIAFTDDDCIVNDDWLYVFSKSFNKDNIGGVGGAVKSKMSDIFSQYFDYMGMFSHLMESNIVYNIITANACYRKDVLVKVGCFTEEIKKPGGEDAILSARVRNLGYVLKYEPEAVVFHYHKSNLRSFIRTFYNYGRGREVVDKELDWNNLPKRRRFSFQQFMKDGGGIGQAFFSLFLWRLQGIAYRVGRRKGY